MNGYREGSVGGPLSQTATRCKRRVIEISEGSKLVQAIWDGLERQLPDDFALHRPLALRYELWSRAESSNVKVMERKTKGMVEVWIFSRCRSRSGRNDPSSLVKNCAEQWKEPLTEILKWVAHYQHTTLDDIIDYWPHCGPLSCFRQM